MTENLCCSLRGQRPGIPWPTVLVVQRPPPPPRLYLHHPPSLTDPCGPLLLPCFSPVLGLLVLTSSPPAGLSCPQPFLQNLCSGARPLLFCLGLSLLLLIGICVIGSQSESHRVAGIRAIVGYNEVGSNGCRDG